MIKGELLKFKQMNYPSGSALVFDRDKLYLMGDDAGGLLVLDTALEKIDSIPVFPSAILKRIKKTVKADIEAGDFFAKKKSLYLFGSGSVSKYRDSLFKIEVDDKQISRIDLSKIYNRIKKSGIKKLNIEAASFVGQKLLLGNRANARYHQNYLILLSEDFEKAQSNTPVGLIKIVPDVASTGISGLAYDPVRDILFISFSTEDTESTYQDGKVGDSYLALIDNISSKLDRDVLYADAWLPLSFVDSSFEKMKVESVTLGDFSDRKYTLFFSADNDDGKTSVFKVLLSF